MPKPDGNTTKERKPLLEHKAVQIRAPLTEDKSKFKQWNIKFVNSMGKVDPKYERALTCIMNWADAEATPDMEAGWPGSTGLFDEIPGLDQDQLDKDLRCVLVEKAEGKVHTKVVNGMPKGGVYVYTDVYKRFTEYIGPGANGAGTLAHGPAAGQERK